MTNITENPDRMAVPLTKGVLRQTVELAYNHPSSTTFCVIGVKQGTPVVVGSRSYTHPSVYNALKECARSEESQWKRILKTYETHVFLGKLSHEILSAFLKDCQKAYGQPRESAFAGRVWSKVSVKNFTTFSAISFWTTESRLKKNNEVLVVLKKAFKLSDPIYFECVGTKVPHLYYDWVSAVDDSESTELKSRVAPKLTQDQIVDILQRAHSSPMTLSPLEKEVVAEFRGRPDINAGTRGGYKTSAEFNFKKTIGDSTVRGFLDLLQG